MTSSDLIEIRAAAQALAAQAEPLALAGEIGEADDRLDRAVALLSTIEPSRREGDVLRDLASLHDQRGALCRSFGRHEDAITHFERGISMLATAWSQNEIRERAAIL